MRFTIYTKSLTQSLGAPDQPALKAATVLVILLRLSRLIQSVLPDPFSLSLSQFQYVV